MSALCWHHFAGITVNGQSPLASCTTAESLVSQLNIEKRRVVGNPLTASTDILKVITSSAADVSVENKTTDADSQQWVGNANAKKPATHVAKVESHLYDILGSDSYDLTDVEHYIDAAERDSSIATAGQSLLSTSLHPIHALVASTSLYTAIPDAVNCQLPGVVCPVVSSGENAVTNFWSATESTGKVDTTDVFIKRGLAQHSLAVMPGVEHSDGREVGYRPVTMSTTSSSGSVTWYPGSLSEQLEVAVTTTSQWKSNSDRSQLVNAGPAIESRVQTSVANSIVLPSAVAGDRIVGMRSPVGCITGPMGYLPIDINRHQPKNPADEVIVCYLCWLYF